jgi:hypothetical protein
MLLCAGSDKSGTASGHIWANDSIGTSLNYTSFVGSIGGQALSSFLSEHKDSIDVATIGSDLQVTVVQKDGSQFVVILDSHKAFQVRERRFYDVDGRLQSTMVVKHMKLGNEDVWVPQEASTQQWGYRGDGSRYAATRSTLEPIERDQFKYNCTFPESHFAAQFPDGTHVFDHVIGIRYTLGSLDDQSFDNLATTANIFNQEQFEQKALYDDSTTFGPLTQTGLEAKSHVANSSSDPTHAPWYRTEINVRGLLLAIMGVIVLGLLIILVAVRHHKVRHRA